MDERLWSAILAHVYAHPDAPEGVEFWQVNRVPWRPRTTPPADTPVAHAPRPARASPTRGGHLIPNASEQLVGMAEGGEVHGVPFGFAWSAEAQRVFIGLPASHGW